MITETGRNLETLAFGKQVRINGDLRSINSAARLVDDIDTSFGKVGRFLLKGIRSKQIAEIGQLADRIEDRTALVDELREGLSGLQYEAKYDNTGFRTNERVHGVVRETDIDISRINSLPNSEGNWSTRWAGEACGVELTQDVARRLFLKYGSPLRRSDK